MIDLEKEYYYALEGRKIWQQIKVKYDFTNMFGLVIFPTTAPVINTQGIAVLPEYREKMFLQKIVVVTNQEEIAQALGTIESEDISCEKISHKEIELLLKYFRLVYFCAHIVVVSLEEPFGNNSFLSNKEVDLHNYVLSAIFKVR